MTDKLSYSVRKKSGIPILDLCGKLIGSRAFTLKEELIQLKDSGVSSVILNFQDVTSIDSLGAMAIISAIETGLSVRIIHLNTTCKQILDQNRVTKAIPVYGSEEDAMGTMAASNNGFKEMRRFKRLNTSIPVEIVLNQDKHRGVLLNISEGGALIGYLDSISPEPYAFKQIHITMELPLLGSIALEGKPVRFGRTSEMHIIGIELLSTEKSQNLVKQVYKDASLSSNHSRYSQ